jgi:hypothetical protein
LSEEGKGLRSRLQSPFVADASLLYAPTSTDAVGDHEEYIARTDAIDKLAVDNDKQCLIRQKLFRSRPNQTCISHFPKKFEEELRGSVFILIVPSIFSL